MKYNNGWNGWMHGMNCKEPNKLFACFAKLLQRSPKLILLYILQPVFSLTLGEDLTWRLFTEESSIARRTVTAGILCPWSGCHRGTRPMVLTWIVRTGSWKTIKNTPELENMFFHVLHQNYLKYWYIIILDKIMTHCYLSWWWKENTDEPNKSILNFANQIITRFEHIRSELRLNLTLKIIKAMELQWKSACNSSWRINLPGITWTLQSSPE